MNKKLEIQNKINCPHFEKCSGCEIENGVDRPKILEEAVEYFEKLQVKHVSHFFDQPSGWRYRAKLVVQGSSDHPIIGLYQRKTHQALDIPNCVVHHEKINEAVSLIKKFIKKNQIQPYHEESGTGELRYLQLVVQKKTGKVQISFVLNKNEETNPEKWILEETDFWHSIWLNFNDKKTNTIFGKNWSLLKGEPLLLEEFLSRDIYFHPASFAQSNHDCFEKMLTSIQTKIPKNLDVIEYYAGVGVIGLTLVGHVRSVLAVEIVEQAKICFEASKERLPNHLQDQIHFELGASESLLNLMHQKDVILLDPPRKGLDLKLLNAIILEKSLQQIVYVSCGFKSFQRDCDLILASGDWILDSVETYVFFPGANHIELLTVFIKKPTALI